MAEGAKAGASAVELPPAAVGGGSRRSGSLLARITPERIVTIVLIIVVGWLVLYPVGWLFWSLFHRGAPGDAGDWTLENLRVVLLNWDYWILVWRSLYVGVGITLLASLIGVPLAWLNVKTDIPAKKLVELSALLPFFSSTFVGALAWIFIGNPTNGVLKLWFGLPVNVYTTGGIIWVTGIYMAPYMYLFTSAALRNMDTSLEEASFMCRANLFRTLLKVTFPLILPALLSGMSLVLVISMSMFGVAAILGFPGRISLLATEIYTKVSNTPVDYGAATVTGLTLTAITVVLLYIRKFVLGRRSYVSVGGRGHQARIYELGGWKWVALGGAALYALLAVILPFLVLLKASLQLFPTPRFIGWTLQHWALFFQRPDIVETLFRSLYLSTFGALACILLAALTAYTIHRTKIPGRRLLEQVANIPVGIPGIVMALGMLWAYIGLPVWGSLWLLLMAYLTLFLPYGVQLIGSTIVQIHPELEESSRVHRAGWARTFGLIMLPLLRPGLYSAWILLFVIFVREISAAVLLTSYQNRVFPILIFQQWADGRLNVMAAGALLLTFIMLVVIVIFSKLFKADLMAAYR